MTIHRTRNLDNVPFDILYQIVCSLDCDDYVSLSRVNKALDAALRNDLLAKKTVEVASRIPHGPTHSEIDREGFVLFPVSCHQFLLS
jgi:hypothetical protein